MESRPGLARSDRGATPQEFLQLVGDPSSFVDAASRLPLGERRVLAALMGRDLRAYAEAPQGAAMREAMTAWTLVERDLQVVQTLARALMVEHRAYRDAESVWLVHGRGDALCVRESGVTYHARFDADAVETSVAAVRDQAARRIWAHRRALPPAVRHFAPFFDS